MFPKEKVAKLTKKYICESCNYKCSRKNDFNKHLLTSKHKKMENAKNILKCPKMAKNV